MNFAVANKLHRESAGPGPAAASNSIACRTRKSMDVALPVVSSPPAWQRLEISNDRISCTLHWTRPGLRLSLRKAARSLSTPTNPTGDPGFLFNQGWRRRENNSVVDLCPRARFRCRRAGPIPYRKTLYLAPETLKRTRALQMPPKSQKKVEFYRNLQKSRR
jgi:hypothetical protein